ncbi:hypothetical protein [Endozoicomonas sp.]|uniref:hypothetical protein n=1 Tax=Endozoicomonas sp. TaxID=1892382 RepID=UPI00383A065C
MNTKKTIGFPCPDIFKAINPFFTATSLVNGLAGRIVATLLIIGVYGIPAQAQDCFQRLSATELSNQHIGYPVHSLYNPKYIADEIGTTYENFVVYLNDEQNKSLLSICPDSSSSRGENNLPTGFLIEKGKNTIDTSLLVSLIVSSTNTLVLVDYTCVTLTSGTEEFKNYAVISKLAFEAKKSSSDSLSFIYQ